MFDKTELDIEVMDLRMANSLLEEKLTTAEERVQELENEVEELEGDIEHKDGKISDLEDERDEALNDRDSWQSDYEAADEERNQLSGTVDDMEDARDKVISAKETLEIAVEKWKPPLDGSFLWTTEQWHDYIRTIIDDLQTDMQDAIDILD